MDVTPLIPQDRKIIQSYSNAGFKVSGESHANAVFVMPTRCWDWNFSGPFDALSEKDFSDLYDVSSDIDVVLLGAGAKGAFFPPALRAALKSKGLVVDVMDTGAACRTYNVLMAEGRRVAAALLPL